MRAIIILAILFAIGLIILMYKREDDIQKMLFSFFVLASILGLGMVGNVMRSVVVIFLSHLTALLFSYAGLLYYIFSEKKQWILWSLPFITLALYIFFAWIGNEHLAGLG